MSNVEESSPPLTRERTSVTTIRRVVAAATAASDGVRRDGDREVPLGPKARRTRTALLRAAYGEFERNGYHQTAVSDIAHAAGVSLGTFYQYFRDRSDVMAALVGAHVLRAVSGQDSTWKPAGGRLGLRRVLAAFVKTYAETARFQAAWEQATHVDPDLAALRRDLSSLFVDATERELRAAQAAGLVRPGLDPARTAVALNAMVDRYCYLTYVFDPPTPVPDLDASVDELTRLWADGIGLVELGDKRTDPT